MLVVGIAAAQPGDTGEKGKKITDRGSKIAPLLTEKINGAKVDEELPLIIFFKKNGKTGSARTMAQNTAVSAVKSHNGKIKHRYMLIDAVSAKMPAGRIAELARSPDIDRIYYDEVYQILPGPEQNSSIKLDVSTQAIGANYVWDTLGYTGSGITVAVVDTGIDYTHPDLGGGWGNRVIGGYDFYNSDGNPMDDHGHGTHVAGTVGANGGLKGVAPGVDFLALKVCSAAGSCPDSDQIAGIDWAVANGADVISISLGGNSQANDEFGDPVSIIVDAAVDSGVVVVIAAGNEGPGTGTTGSPGAAGKVITVGASDDKGTIDISDDTIASFSNRGPSAFGRLDPELVAPGVGINSTCIFSQEAYCSKSGTSMSTPHVSGAAALLLQKTPSLSSAQVRAALMHTASNLTASNSHVFEKGAGIINVTKALAYNISASINGDDRWEESVIPGFTAITELTLINSGATSSVNFTFSFDSMTDLEGDNTVSISNFVLPGFVVVAPNSSETVKLNFSAPSNANPAIYGTALMITGSNSELLRIPIVITIPLVGEGMIQGTVDDDYGLPDYWGDWIYYKIKSHNGTSMTATLDWNSVSHDLDLYLFAPNGELIEYGWYGYPEQVSVSNMAYDEYWLAVHAYDLKGKIEDYSLTVSYDSGLRVSPSSWQGSVAGGEIKNITFTITNDAVAKSGLNVSVNILQDGNDFFTADAVSSGYTIVWSKVDNGTDTTYTKYLNATLRWDDASNNLDLYFAYESEGYWYLTRFMSEHWNDASVEPIEELKFIDIQHYLKTYPDVALIVNNTGGATVTVNLTLNLTDVSPWSAASVNESTISLGADETKQVIVTINGAAQEAGETYDAIFTIQNVTEDFAVVPIRLTITPATFNISLIPEWNLISIPLEQDNWNITSVLAPIDGNYSVVFAYIDDVWEKSTAARDPLTNMSLEYGYWIYMNVSDTLELSGTVPATTTINIVGPGWNLAGYPSFTTRNITDVLSSINYTVVFAYIDDVWEMTTAARDPLAEMTPGLGYWIYANEAGSYEVEY